MNNYDRGSEVSPLTIRIWNCVTIAIRIACEPNSTVTNWQMVYNLTISILTTDTRAWINTFLIDASSV